MNIWWGPMSRDQRFSLELPPYQATQLAITELQLASIVLHWSLWSQLTPTWPNIVVQLIGLHPHRSSPLPHTPWRGYQLRTKKQTWDSGSVTLYIYIYISSLSSSIQVHCLPFSMSRGTVPISTKFCHQTFQSHLNFLSGHHLLCQPSIGVQ